MPELRGKALPVGARAIPIWLAALLADGGLILRRLIESCAVKRRIRTRMLGCPCSPPPPSFHNRKPPASG